jgi:hypothetical protein
MIGAQKDEEARDVNWKLLTFWPRSVSILLPRNPGILREVHQSSKCRRTLGRSPGNVGATFLFPVNRAAAGVIEFDIATADIGMQFKGRVPQGDGGHRIKSPSHRDPRGMAVDLKRGVSWTDGQCVGEKLLPYRGRGWYWLSRLVIL